MTKQLLVEDLAKSVQVVAFRSTVNNKTVTGFSTRWKVGKKPKQAEALRVTCQDTTCAIGGTLISSSNELAESTEFPAVFSLVSDLEESVKIKKLNSKVSEFKLRNQEYRIRRQGSGEISISGPSTNSFLKVNKMLPIQTTRYNNRKTSTWTYKGVKENSNLVVSLSWQKSVQTARSTVVPVSFLKEVTIYKGYEEALSAKDASVAFDEVPKEVVELFHR